MSNVSLPKANFHIPDFGAHLQELLHTCRRLSIEAKKKESDALKQLSIMEHTASMYKTKAEMADVFKKRFHRIQEICDQMSQKKVVDMENFQKLAAFCLQFKTQNEQLHTTAEKLISEKQILANKLKVMKKHIPSMLKLFDDLVIHTNDLPYTIRRRVDFFAEQAVRAQLLEGMPLSNEQNNSDNELVGDIETLVIGGVRTTAPLKKSRAGIRRGPVSRTRTTGGMKRAKRNEQQDIKEAEEAYNTRLQNKLSKGEHIVKSEITGGHRTIHGKKGPTVREQQAEMMTVKDKVAQMKSQHIDQIEPSLTHPLSEETASVSASVHKENPSVNGIRKERDKMSDLARDLELTPSPTKKPKYSSINEDEAKMLVSQVFHELQDLLQRLGIVIRCYKIEENKSELNGSIFANPISNIRDPPPELISLIVENSISIPVSVTILLRDPSEVTCIKPADILGRVVQCEEMAFTINNFLEKHLKDAPPQRLSLHKSLQSFITFSKKINSDN